MSVACKLSEVGQYERCRGGGGGSASGGGAKLFGPVSAAAAVAMSSSAIAPSIVGAALVATVWVADSLVTLGVLEAWSAPVVTPPSDQRCRGGGGCCASGGGAKLLGPVSAAAALAMSSSAIAPSPVGAALMAAVGVAYGLVTLGVLEAWSTPVVTPPSDHLRGRCRCSCGSHYFDMAALYVLAVKLHGEQPLSVDRIRHAVSAELLRIAGQAALPTAHYQLYRGAMRCCHKGSK